MNTSFITVDSKLSFDNTYLNIRKLKYGPTRSYWFDSFILLSLFIGFQVYRAIYDKPRVWVLVLLGLIWIYPHLERIFKLFFVDKWGNRIKLVTIKEIKILPPNNELETIVVIKMITGRQKTLIFRNAENQHEGFIELLESKLNPNRLNDV